MIKSLTLGTAVLSIAGLMTLGTCSSALPDGMSQQPGGYCSAAAFGEGFLVAGSQGKLAYVTSDGLVSALISDGQQDWKDISAFESNAAVVGTAGAALLVGQDQTTQPVSLDTKVDLLSTCFFQNQWLVGAEAGMVCRSSDFGQTWNTTTVGVAGDIVGLATTEARCIGVTDQGEVIVSEDGSVWNVLDYNAYYQTDVTFQDITVVDNVFWAYGQKADGTTTVVTSMEGTVWGNRDLNVYEYDQTIDGTRMRLYDIASDGVQAYAVTENGNVLVLPGCTTCNTLRNVSSLPIYATAYNEEYLVFAGADDSVTVQSIYSIRQGGIKAEAAKTMQQNGAVIIDVRSIEEYETAHIPGSIHMDAADVDTALPQQYPQRDQPIIFYCASGKRSQTAMETAQSMGYGNVYNLGGISNWTYELEP